MKKKIKSNKKIKKSIGKIAPDTTIQEIINKYPEKAKVLIKHGMTCVGCPFALQETIEQGAMAHGIDSEKLIKDLNKKINKQRR